MMIAVVMLFSMSYWLLSKAEARNWKAYLEGKFAKSLSSGSIIGLWLTSFLAVYREGAETVLFYLALIGDCQYHQRPLIGSGRFWRWLCDLAGGLFGDALYRGQTTT